MSRLRAPTMQELVPMIQGLPDGPRRTQLEEWYWAKAIDRHGPLFASWYRHESQWLRRAGW